MYIKLAYLPLTCVVSVLTLPVTGPAFAQQDFPDQADPDRRRRRSRRRHGHPRARARHEAGREPPPAGDRRQPPGREPHHRRAVDAEVAAGRLHDAGHPGRLGHQCVHVFEAAVRPGARFLPDRDHGAGSERTGDPSLAPGAHRQAVHRAGACPAGPDELWDVRRRGAEPHVGGAIEGPCARRVHARALQGAGAGGHRRCWAESWSLRFRRSWRRSDTSAPAGWSRWA